MKFRISAITISLALVMATLVAAPASVLAGTPPNGNVPGPSDFQPHIYADGVAWASETGPNLPMPNGHNDRSFNFIVTFTNGAAGQLPVAQFAPGDVGYAGGRWNVQSATWNVTPYLLTSYADVVNAENSGDLTVVSVNFYFQCPLLPVK